MLRAAIFGAVCLSPSAFGSSLDAGTLSFKARRSAAQSHYDAKDFAVCETEYEALAEKAPAWASPGDSLYNAACCAALAGHADHAFALLDALVTLGDSGAARDVAADDDLTSLHSDKRWPAFTARVAALVAKDTISPAIAALVDADQADRAQDPSRWTKTQISAFVARDAARRAKLSKLLNAGAAKTVRDYWSAALVFQHGLTATNYARAHALAKKAVSLRPDWCLALKMTALTEDRHLESLGKLQKYGTQYRCPEGQFSHCPRAPVDPAVTDAEREALCVPPLAEQDDEKSIGR